MKKTSLLVWALLAASPAAFAIDLNAVVGGAIGGGAGAAIGQKVGGQNGAIIGGAIGGATGAAIATSNQPAPATVQVVQPVPVAEREDEGEHRRHRSHERD